MMFAGGDDQSEMSGMMRVNDDDAESDATGMMRAGGDDQSEASGMMRVGGDEAESDATGMIKVAEVAEDDESDASGLKFEDRRGNADAIPSSMLEEIE